MLNATSSKMDVRLWHKADIVPASLHVRFLG